MGTGPFVIDHYTKASEVLLTKRADYAWGSPHAAHEGEAYLDEVNVQIVTEASVRDGLLSSGQVDGIRNPTETQQETFSTAPFVSAIRPNPGIASAIDWNYGRDVIRDKNVRLAVLKGIDREELEATVLGPFGLAATSVLTSSILGFADNSELLAYDPEGSESLLESSGWIVGADGIREKNGERLTISGVVFDYQKPIAELEAQQLAKVGIELDLTLASNASIGTEWKSGKYDFFQHANTAADPDVLRGWFLTSLNGEPPRQFTEQTTDLDALLLKQPSLANGDDRAEVLADIQRIILENAYNVPINQSVNVFAFSDKVQGFTLDAQSSSRFYDAWKQQ